jgi:hypothetical protein
MVQPSLYGNMTETNILPVGRGDRGYLKRSRSKIILVRITVNEMKKIGQAAKADNKTMTDWARERFGLI